MWAGILRFAVVAFAGAGFTDFFTNLFGGKTAVESATSINWTRVIIGSVAVVAAFLVAKMIFKQKFD